MKKLFFLFSVVMCLGLSAQNPTITLMRGTVAEKTYGDTSSDATTNGLALAEAIVDAQEADQILLMGKQESFAGVYAGTFTVSQNIVIKGVGGAAILQPVSSELAPTNRVMNINSTEATFENLIITGGRLLNGNGAGVNVSSGGNTFRNCLFTNNQAETDGTFASWGAAFFIKGGAAGGRSFVENCSFINNAAWVCRANTDQTGNRGGASQLWAGKIDSRFENCAYEGAMIADPAATVINCFQLTKEHASPFVYPTASAGFNPAGVGANDLTDWSLAEGSFLINRGQDNSASLPTDILDNERKQWLNVDIGAYESAHKGSVCFNVMPNEVEVIQGGVLPSFTVAPFPPFPALAAVATGLPANTHTVGEYSISATVVNPDDMLLWDTTTANATLRVIPAQPIVDIEDETPILIVMGQSNADGSAFADAAEDARLAAWYDAQTNADLMKVWYKSSYIVNQSSGARLVFEGTTTDVPDGWLNLHYKNDNTNGRTSMIMLHGSGTWSENAAGRRGMEGQFGMKYQEQYPGKELYIIKLGCSGSSIDDWNQHGSNHNWDYFYTKIYRPAINDLIARGKKPRLMGIWWMQGEANRAETQAVHEAKLKQVITQSRDSFGFANAPVYIGHIVAPGENPAFPNASTQYGAGVRAAQNSIAASDSRVYIVPTQDCPFGADNLHFSHLGMSMIGNKIAADIFGKGVESWEAYHTPGVWSHLEQQAGAVVAVCFVPSLGVPIRQTILYQVGGQWVETLPTAADVYAVKAVLDFGTWEDEVEAQLTIASTSGIDGVKTNCQLSFFIQNDQIVVTNMCEEPLTLTFHNTLGQPVGQVNIVDYRTIVSTAQWASGVYAVAYVGATQRGQTKIVLP